MYLFSVLGVEGEVNGTILWLGTAGLGTVGAAIVIEMVALARGSSGTGGRRRVVERSLRESSDLKTERRSSDLKTERRLSLRGLEKDMIIAGMV